MVAAFAWYHRGHASAICRSVASPGRWRAAMDHRLSPATTTTDPAELVAAADEGTGAAGGPASTGPGSAAALGTAVASATGSDAATVASSRGSVVTAQPRSSALTVLPPEAV